MRSTLKERLSLLPEIAYQHVFRASSEGESGASYLDFSILSVAVTTLGLILLVQLIRHRLDRNATGRPFFKTVLEGVYRELATLGIVEFVIFLLHKYYSDLNVAQELIFADVHFTLFFTALFNAFQSCILAFFISRNSHRLWVQTEYQDLHHYVEIREEFDRLDKELREFREPLSVRSASFDSNKTNRSNGSLRQSMTSQMWATEESDQVRGEFGYSLRSIKNIWYFLLRSARYPRLSRKHNDLLVQVRFHELKFHFIQANKLPITMHLSDYMKRCELRILQKLVHIRTLAWLLLTAGLNLLYFLMGVVVYTTDGDLAVVGETLTALYFSGIVGFVALSLIIWNKMTWIFHTIMHTKLITQSGPVEQHENDEGLDQPANDELPAFNQQSLFWGSSPRYIIILIQFMQFGFALALSILLVFWDDIHPQSGSPGLKAGYFLFAVVVGYICFVAIISRVVPRFTLCSSIGQMVDHDQLHETLARHRLKEAQRNRQQRLMEQELEETIRQEEGDYSQYLLGLVSGNYGPLFKSQVTSLSSRVLMDPTLLQELIKTSTEDLRKTLPTKQRDELNEQDKAIQARRSRRKTLSDGVEAMREMVGLGSEMSSSVSADSRKANRHFRRKSLSASASIQMMRDVKSLSVPLKLEVPDAPLKTKDDLDGSLDDRAKRRANRRKTISASADIRMMRMGSHPDVLKSDSAPSKTVGSIDDAPADGRRVSFAESNSSTSLVASPQQQLRKSFSVSGQQPLTKISEFESARNHPLLSDRFEASPGASQSPLDRVDNEADSSISISDSRLSIREALAGHNSNLIIENIKMPTLGDEAVTEADSDDEHSDVDDLPEVQESDKLRKAEPLPPKRTLLDIARAYFRGRSYILVSSLLGTMVCFFIVGMRLEAVLIDTGVLVNYDNTWHLQAQVSFWVEFGLLTCFIFGDFVVLYIFRPERMYDNRDRRVFVATIIDLSICVTCIGCLIGAQVQRCCDNTDKRFLGGSETPESYYGYEKPIACCPPFGERLYGGYGSIEMFTSLVGLRVVRFFAAKVCIQAFYKHNSLPETATTSAQGDSPPVKYPLDPFYEVRVHDHSKRRARLQDETGTIVELWKSALALHPDIVAKHGEFSGQLLQAMLGIPVMSDDTVGSAEAIKESKTEDAVDGAYPEHLGESKPMSRVRSDSGDTPMSMRRLGSGDMSISMRLQGSGDVDQHQVLSRPSIISDRRYSSLSAAAQSVILAGKLGKAVRAKHEGDNSHSLGSLLEETPTSNAEAGIPASSNARRAAFHKERPALHHFGESQTDLGWAAQLAQMPEFEIRTDDNDDDESASQFFAPNSRLIRSMRRCDRKVMPMLDRWAVVDVVMTTFEIVYFDASDVDNLGGSANPRVKRMEDIRQAIIATKGGKGLRLRDVAFGRRVVGTQVLNDIESIHVDRILPQMHRHDSLEAAGRAPQADEFWKEKVHHSAASGETMPEGVKPPRHSRWISIKEDRLKVKTKHDTTLYLRFYSDLENCESHQERMMNELETEGNLFKNNAFQWCQTIGRIVGASKLKQDLPHFGEDSSDELRDYLVVVDLNKEQHTIPAVDRFKKLVTLHLRQRSDVPAFVIGSPPSHRRHQSEMPTVLSEGMGGATAPTPPPTMSIPRPSVVRRVTSLGDALKGSGAATGGATKAALKKGHIRRASSVGETASVALSVTLPSQAILVAGPAAEDAPDSSLENGGKTLL